MDVEQWGCGRTIPFLGINKLDFRCSASWRVGIVLNEFINVTL
jgi:hypothetical protein